MPVSKRSRVCGKFFLSTNGHRIVENSLQEKDHIVGELTGDGVTDAPALKKANAGIAGGRHRRRKVRTAISDQADLSAIIDAIKESRKIFQRMTNYARTASPKPFGYCFL